MTDKKAVSPVIGVILMVAITVVLAAVIYLWVSTIWVTGKSATPMSVTCEREETTYLVEVRGTTNPVSAAGIEVVVIDADTGESNSLGTASDLMGSGGNESFTDVNGNGMVNGGDLFSFEQPKYEHGDRVVFTYVATKSTIAEITLTG